MTEWGPALTGPECIQLRLPDDILVCCCRVVRRASHWGFTSTSTKYALPANHPAYKVAEYNRKNPVPMVYHGGSDAAPKDWKPGNDILFANGTVPERSDGWSWFWIPEPRSFNIIGYVPTPVEESDTVTLKRMTEEEWGYQCRHGTLLWAKRVGLIREETLFEQMKREHPDCSQWYGETAVKNTIDWMEKRQGDKS